MNGLLENLTIYRLWRLRRLVLVSVALPAISLVGLWSLYQPGGILWDASVPAALVVLWAIVAVWHALRYPRAMANLLNFGLATAVLVQAVPLGDWLFAQVKGPIEPPHILGMAVLGFLLWLSAGLSFEALLLRLLPLGRKGSYRLRKVSVSALPPSALLPLLLPRPDTVTPLRRYGPADADGRFAVWETLLNPQGTTLGPWAKADSRPPDYWVLTVTQDGSGQFTALYATPEVGTEAVVTTVSAEGEGSRIEQDSLSDIMTPAARVMRYLADVGTDLAVAENDLLEGRTQARANCAQAMDYPGRSWIESLKASESVPPYF